MPLLSLALMVASAPAASHHASPLSISTAAVVEAFRPIALAPAPFGSKFVATMEDGSVRIIDGKTHQTVRALRTHVQPAYAAAWSPDGKLVATGDESGRVWIENALTGAAVRGYRTHTKGVEKLSFNSFGNLLISTGKDDQVNVYDLTDPKPKEARHILGHGQNFYGATFDPHSTRFFTVGMLGGGMREYDAMTGNVCHFLPDPDGQGIWDVCYSASGTREVSAGRDGNAIVWDSKSCKKINSLKGHQDWVVTAAISPNGRYAATGSTDRTVKVWDLQTFGKVADIQQQCPVGSPVCFTADGLALVSVTDTGFLQINDINPAQCVVKEVVPPKGSKKEHWRRRPSS
ncbi:MAG TPA: hypothetical protein VG944_13715 [Fimbriimonas sp.]|nr:hypothetical protein [Fimbriimonas sp.]